MLCSSVGHIENFLSRRYNNAYKTHGSLFSRLMKIVGKWRLFGGAVYKSGTELRVVLLGLSPILGWVFSNPCMFE